MFSSLIPSLIVFGIAALAIVSAGSQLARLADELADRTGMGEALFGVLLLAGVTSLPDFAATLSAAMDARPDLAMSNVMGSMAVNLAFLGIAALALAGCLACGGGQSGCPPFPIPNPYEPR